MGALPVLAELIRWDAVAAHQGFIVMASGTGSGDVGWMHVAAHVFRWKNRVRVMTIGAGRCVEIAAFQQQSTMPASPELCQLVGG